MTTVTIRNVPEETRSELAARAARSGRSLQEYLLAQLVELARKPDLDTVVDRVEARKAATGTRLDRSTILEHRDAGRR